MLEQEMWKQLPTPPGRRPNFKAALEGRGESQAVQSFDTSSFSEWVAAGNPWRRQDSGTNLDSQLTLVCSFIKQAGLPSSKFCHKLIQVQVIFIGVLKCVDRLYEDYSLLVWVVGRPSQKLVRADLGRGTEQ